MINGFHWDDRRDEDGNVRHCLRHRVHWYEVEQVVSDPNSHWYTDESRGDSPKFIVEGRTKTGRRLRVHGLIFSRPPKKGQWYTITAYDI